ncbi:MAG TPA: hypothetical protein DCY13_14880, partial [Verrucomicrobiales bacterium]|nr:hypothetical protein [Verrucomicrobiales bacterium]
MWSNSTMATIEEIKSRISGAAGDIVRKGQNVRASIAKLTTDAAKELQHTADGLANVGRAVIQGAGRAAADALPAEGESRLREVVDGLADGFRTAAEAIDLTLRESAAEGRRFAAEDIKKAQADLDAVGGMVAQTLGDFAGELKDTAVGQSNSLRQHAERAFAQVKPAFESALSNLWKHGGEVGREAGQAGAAAARAGAGT